MSGDGRVNVSVEVVEAAVECWFSGLPENEARLFWMRTRPPGEIVPEGLA